MAIIYETKEDFERDKLKDQHKDMSLRSEKQNSLGLALVLGGAIVDQLNTKRSRGWSYASMGLSVVGLVEVVKSLFTGHKAHDLKLQHERMGPQTSVIPADASIPVVGDDCAVCKHTANIVHKTLLEQAEKPDISIVRG